MNKRITLGASLVLAFASLIGLVQTQQTSAVSVDNEDKVTICHRTNSTSNPYNQNDVALDSVNGDGGNDNGNGDHSKHLGPVWDANTNYPAPHNGDQWGDIIPPVPGRPNGLNWTAAGQAIYNNGCNYAPANVTFTDPTCEALGTYTIPESEGFTYSINKDVTAAGEYTAPNGSTVTIIVHALEGYELDGATSEWTHTFTAPAEADCVLGSTSTPPAKLPVTSGDSTIANVAILSSIVGLVTILSLVARSVLARQI